MVPADTPRARPTTLVLLIAAVLLAAACGGSGGTDPTGAGPSPDAAATSPGATETSFPVSVTSGDGRITVSERPTRIVSLSPTATEMLFAVGAGDQVVAVDDQSDHPPEAPTTDLSGFQPNVEAILAEEPDLVLAQSDPGGLVDGLAEADVPTLLLPSATVLEDAYAQLERVGAVTGHVAGAAEVVGRMRAEMAEIVASLPDREQSLTYYHELDPTFYTITGDTFVGDVYGRLGLDSIADAASAEGAYPQLSQEFVVEADPDVIFLADAQCCDVTAEAVAERPGWGEISAVQNDAVFEVDADLASRWGPRIVDYARNVAERLAALPQPAAS